MRSKWTMKMTICHPRKKRLQQSIAELKIGQLRRKSLVLKGLKNAQPSAKKTQKICGGGVHVTQGARKPK
jgi:hypothetical protein